MFEFVVQHQLWTAVAIYWVYSAAVSSMPDPRQWQSGLSWLYRFCHTVAGNITTAFLGRYRACAAFLGRYRACASRGSRTRVNRLGLVWIAPLLLWTSACAAHYTVHPGALSKTDSAAYDALRIAETTIDQARLEYKAGQLPGKAREALDALIRSYNIARDSWLTYRGAIAADTPDGVYFNQLTKALLDLAGAIRAFKLGAATSERRNEY